MYNNVGEQWRRDGNVDSEDTQTDVNPCLWRGKPVYWNTAVWKGKIIGDVSVGYLSQFT